MIHPGARWRPSRAPRRAIRAIEIEAARPAVGFPLRRAVVDVQPPDTVVVDLRQSEEAILAAMKAKWRYNVRYAEKKGVIVEEAGEESVPVFYALNRLTAARDRIAVRSEGYYARLFSLHPSEGTRGFPERRTCVFG